MGGLVGGMYATGKSPDELEQLVKVMDWPLIIGGGHDYSEQNEPNPQRKEVRTPASASKWTNAIHGDLRFLQTLSPLRIQSAPLESAQRNQATGSPLGPQR